ncbi:MAG: segregation/condensation protein A [Candidatus Liptonbacteria bacterium]|nr:segregation/condensation protein A [Candidatus Liptonbacteria bacterium]
MPPLESSAGYSVKLTQFQGPIGALLDLIEARQLEIAEISLAQVTEDFLRYLEAFSGESAIASGLSSEERLRLVADFLVVASQLLLVKSKGLLPNLSLTPDEEASIHDLEDRLKLYRELRPAMREILRLWRAGQRFYGRPYLLSVLSLVLEARRTSGESACYPGQNLTAGSLQNGLSRVLDYWVEASHEQEVITQRIVSLEEEVKSILSRLGIGGNSSLTELSAERSRSELVIIFLALLHLARDQVVTLAQPGQFSDILVERKSPLPEEVAENN